MGESSHRIVADGRERLRREEWYRRREREVGEAVRNEYEARLSMTSGFERVLVYLRMRRELRRELEDLAPQRSMYMRSS